MRLPEWVVVAASLSMFSCGRGAVRAPAGVDAPTEKELLGAEPDFAVAVRVDRIRVDPIYAPLLQEISKDKKLDEVTAGIDIVDMIGTFDGVDLKKPSLVLTGRSANPIALPPEWQKSVEDGKNGHQLASGVWEYTTLDKDGWPYGIYLAPRDWVLVSGRAAGHGHDYFSTHNASPPAVDFGDDVLIGIWSGAHAMKTEAMKEAAKEPGTRGLESASILLRDGAHGDLLYAGTYQTDAYAEDAVRITTDRVGMYASIWKNAVDVCPGLGALKLESERSGRTIRFHVTHIPEALRAALGCKMK